MQGNAAEEVVSFAFTIDRKGNVLGSRIETTSDDLDARRSRCSSVAGRAATRRQLRQGSQAVL